MKVRTKAACAASFLLAACISVVLPGPSREEDQAELARLEAEARALANPDGCSRPGDCRSAPVGARACGGPRTHLVYCAATTDTLELARRLEKLRRAEEAFNLRHGIVSTCDARLPPQTELVGGTCRAK